MLSGKVARFVEHAVDPYDRLDCAFNNAGIEGSYARTAASFVTGTTLSVDGAYLAK